MISVKKVETITKIYILRFLLGVIQQLRNPFLRHFSLGTPPFPLHNFLADQVGGASKIM